VDATAEKQAPATLEDEQRVYDSCAAQLRGAVSNDAVVRKISHHAYELARLIPNGAKIDLVFVERAQVATLAGTEEQVQGMRNITIFRPAAAFKEALVVPVTKKA
jgi:hypothetical protein